MARQEQRSSSTTLPEPLRTAASALRHVPGAGMVSRVAGGALDKVGAVSPRGRRLAVYTGAGVLGVAGVVEWPVALTGAAVAWLTQPRPEERERSGDAGDSRGSGESWGGVPAGEIGVIPLDEEPEEPETPADEMGEMRAGEVRETPSGRGSEASSGQGAEMFGQGSERSSGHGPDTSSGQGPDTSSGQVFEAPSGDVGTTPGAGRGGAPGGLPSDEQPVVTGDTQLPTGPRAPAPGEAETTTDDEERILGRHAPVLGAMEPVTGDGRQLSDTQAAGPGWTGVETPEAGAMAPVPGDTRQTPGQAPGPVLARDVEDLPGPEAPEPGAAAEKGAGDVPQASGTEAPGPVLARDVEDLPGPEAPEPGAAESGSDDGGVGGRASGEGV
ncbi:hypothetical protein [Streptomyces sp. NPDC094149]|uniref:hypothetical protein n=1 Tax=Streptomyces sp. NPDC094149 TaxID=3155079 RepID=UPI00332D9246